MFHRHHVPEEVIRLAHEQAGVVSRAQALGLGLTAEVIRRLRAEGRWGNLESGLYLVPLAQPTWRTQVWAGILLGGVDARVGGLTAAALSGLADVEQLPIDVLVPCGHRVADRDWVSFRQERPRLRAASGRSEPPRTRIDDTVLDLCAIGDEADCVDWLTRAVQRRLTTPRALLTTLARRPRMRNRKLITDLLTDVASGVHSALEHRYLHDVERAHDLPRADRQHRGPGRQAFIDVAYLAYGLLVELDGRIGHVEEGRWRDRHRDNVHARSALLTLRFGWHEVTDEPCAVALQVAEALIERGWAGSPGTCGRCSRSRY